MSYKAIEKYISPLIESQFPQFYREEGPRFVSFIKAYYEWLETQQAYSLNIDYPSIDLTVGKKIIQLNNGSITGIVTNFTTTPEPYAKILGDVSSFDTNQNVYQINQETSYIDDSSVLVRVDQGNGYKVSLSSSKYVFSDLVSVGDYIEVNGQIRRVSFIDTDYLLSVSTKFTNTSIEYKSTCKVYQLSLPFNVREVYKSPLPLAKARNLFEYISLDDTLDTFVDHFRKKYFNVLPKQILADKKLVAKHILDLYRAKGTKRAYELLFRMLYNEDVDVYIPGNDILRASDGQYVLPRYLEVTSADGLENLIGEQIVGSAGGATALVENVSSKIVNGRLINVLEISNLNGDFNYNDYVLNTSYFPTTDTACRVIGSLSSIGIKNGGTGYNVGDILSVAGNGEGGLVRVAATKTENGKVTFKLVDGGSGYTVNAVVTVSGGGGTGATFKVGGANFLELINRETILLNDDYVGDYLLLELQNTVDGVRLNYNSNTNIFSNQSACNVSFNANTDVNQTSDFIFIATNPFANDDLLVYTTAAGNTILSGLTNTGSYYVVSSNSTGIKLSTTRGGSAIDLTASSISENGHIFTRYPEYVSVSSSNTIPIDIQLLSNTEFQLNEVIKNHTSINLNVGTNVASNGMITIGSNPFVNNDIITYRVAVGNSKITELSNTTNYYVVGANSTVIYLANTSGGTPLTLTPGSSETGHYLTRTTTSNNGYIVWNDSSIIEVKGNTYPFVETYYDWTSEVIEGANSGATAKINTVHPAKTYYANAKVVSVNTAGSYIIVQDILGIGNDYLRLTSVNVPNTIVATNSPSGGNSYANGTNITFTSGDAGGLAYTNANGKITSVQMRSYGSNYTSTPDAVVANNNTVRKIVINGSGALYSNGESIIFNGGDNNANGYLITNSFGAITNVVIVNAGTNYDLKNFNANTSVSANGRIAISSNPYSNNDVVVYYIDTTNTVIAELTNGREYYVVDSNSTHLYLSTTQGGSKITLTKGATESGHYLTRVSQLSTTISTTSGVGANIYAYAATGAVLAPVITRAASGFNINSTMTASATGTTANITAISEETDWAFPRVTAPDVDHLRQIIEGTLNINEYEVGTIQFLKDINPGSGYSSDPTVNVVEPLVAALGRFDENGNIKGNNAVITATALNANGIVTAVQVIDSGFGYDPNETISLANTEINQTSVTGGAVVEGAGRAEGYWKDNRGFLSSDKYLIDSYFYQEFSYEIRSSVLFDKYKDIVKQLIHPAGIALFGKYDRQAFIENDTGGFVQSQLDQS